MKFFKFIKNSEKHIPERIHEHLSEFRENEDIEENELSSPPENEQVKVRCIWVIEIYPPSHIKNLLSCIETYGWDDPVRGNVSKWIKEHRQGSFGSYFNLNYLRNTKTSTNRFAPIPEGFDGAFGSILQLIPSTTILIMQFIVNSETEQIFEKPLKDKYSTYIVSKNGIHTYISPINQKQIAVENIRKSLYKKCYEWFNAYVPGVFSSGINDGHLPTVEFITLNTGKPFVDTVKNYTFDYMKMLGLSETVYVWKCNDLPGILLGIPTINENDYSRLFFSGNFSEIFLNNEILLGGHEKNTFGLSIALDRLTDEIGLWSLLVFIKAYKSELSKIRDKTVLLNFNSIDLAIKEIRQLEKIFMEIERDISYFSMELKYYCNKENFVHKYYEFIPINSWISKNDFFENTRLRIINQIDFIKESQKNIRDVISVTSQNISSLSNDYVARTNINIQNQIKYLTYAILLLTILTGWNQISLFLYKFWIYFTK